MKTPAKLFCLLIVFLSACQINEVQYENATLIQNISTIDAVNGLKENQTVVIKDGKIVEVISSDDIRNTQSIHTVMKQGKVYDREALDGMLNGLRK